MNARLPGPVKTCLLSVTTCLSLGAGESAFAQSGAEAQLQSSSATSATRAPAAGDKIRQTAIWQLPRQSAAPVSGARGSSGNVQQELQELYRKNGREMPNMNLSEMEVQGSAPRNVPPGRHAPNAISGANVQQPQPAKPNFFQRIFGRSTSRSNTNARAPYQQNQPGPSAARPNPAMPNSQFQPSRAAVQPGYMPPAATAAPRALNTPAPQQLPQASNQPRQPYVVPHAQPVQPHAVRPQPGNTNNRAAQPVLDLPNLDSGSGLGDNENLNDLDNPAPRAAQAPAIEPKRTPRQPAASPYSGLTITPGEKELYPTPLSTGVAAEEEETVTESIERAPSRILSRPEDDAGVRPVPTDDTEGPTLPATRAGETGESDLGSLKLDEAAADRKQPEESLEIILDETPVPRKTAPISRPAATEPEQAAETPAESQPQLSPRLRPSTDLREKRLPGNEPDESGIVVRSAARAEFRGFRGFCPVTLRDERKLVPADSRFKFEYRGRFYNFATEEARDAFEENPQRYLPAKAGADVVRLAAGEEEPEGSIEHAAWYRGKLYLFSNHVSREEFFAAPSQFISRD